MPSPLSVNAAPLGALGADSAKLSRSGSVQVTVVLTVPFSSTLTALSGSSQTTVGGSSTAATSTVTSASLLRPSGSVTRKANSSVPLASAFGV